MLRTLDRIVTFAAKNRFYSKINKQIDYSLVPELTESDFREKHIKGSGPGGSKIATTCNCVELKHIPSGIIVKCQETRYLEVNRKKARSILRTKLDNHLNGEKSIEAQIKRLQQKKKAFDDKKKAEKRVMKEIWKEQEKLH
ncbi:unnamed protein product [Ceutorhynchus assimilis]|uniref:Prokaryotic-type class I peptide chain release factors domain-containing protein n=1 Tax=Ceutorhynchus assimilis TaxID=467358 RepID=A0A9N9MC17_9CUCU|nr:unnamed protein product [Ceutorhynchus assimilis]